MSAMTQPFRSILLIGVTLTVLVGASLLVSSDDTQAQNTTPVAESLVGEKYLAGEVLTVSQPLSGPRHEVRLSQDGLWWRLQTIHWDKDLGLEPGKPLAISAPSLHLVGHTTEVMGDLKVSGQLQARELASVQQQVESLARILNSLSSEMTTLRSEVQNLRQSMEMEKMRGSTVTQPANEMSRGLRALQNEIGVLQTEAQRLRRDLDTKATTQHRHLDHADRNHQHSGYANQNHRHSEYADRNHQH